MMLLEDVSASKITAGNSFVDLGDAISRVLITSVNEALKMLRNFNVYLGIMVSDNEYILKITLMI